MSTTSPISEFKDLTPENQAAQLLFFRERGFTSVRRLATLMELSLDRVELLMCRALSTLVARGYAAEDLCEAYSLTPEQLARAAAAATFSETFTPTGDWLWGAERPQAQQPSHPEAATQAAAA